MPIIMTKENALLRMQEDLQRALQKPVEQRRWGMVIDVTKCTGCQACVVACKSENKTPPGVAYNIVLEEEVGAYPNVRRLFISRPCMQCSNPPCTKVCPVNATYQRADGVTVVDYDLCIGCRYCIAACPYGSRHFDFGEFYTEDTPEMQSYELGPTYEYGQKGMREKGKSPIGNVRKCHFCLHRVEEGLLPACITDCIGRSRYFGDLNDPDSLVSNLLRRRYAFRLKEELGTEPKVYYLS